MLSIVIIFWSIGVTPATIFQTKLSHTNWPKFQVPWTRNCGFLEWTKSRNYKKKQLQICSDLADFKGRLCGFTRSNTCLQNILTTKTFLPQHGSENHPCLQNLLVHFLHEMGRSFWIPRDVSRSLCCHVYSIVGTLTLKLTKTPSSHPIGLAFFGTKEPKSHTAPASCFFFFSGRYGKIATYHRRTTAQFTHIHMKIHVDPVRPHG